jgi:hypothetical protein
MSGGLKVALSLLLPKSEEQPSRSGTRRRQVAHQNLFQSLGARLERSESLMSPCFNASPIQGEPARSFKNAKKKNEPAPKNDRRLHKATSHPTNEESIDVTSAKSEQGEGNSPPFRPSIQHQRSRLQQSPTWLSKAVPNRRCPHRSPQLSSSAIPTEISLEG